MIKYFLTILSITISTVIDAQNLYPKKLDNCITTQFCLDCGDIKANVDKEKYEKLIANLISNNLKGIEGRVHIQALYSADVILLGSSSKLWLLVVDLASLPGQTVD